MNRKEIRVAFKNIFCILVFMKKFIFFIVAFVILEFAQETIAGPDVKVVDGDSLELSGRRVRLIGIDAPEYFQLCQDKEGQEYMCGQKAKDFLQNLIDEGRSKGIKLKCKTEDVDRYNRDLSVCKMGDVYLNLEMVKAGYAVSYRNDMYQIAEKRAKKAKKGILQGNFMRTELYRALERKKKN